MKKGDKVEIKKTAKYSGQDMKWTETPTHTVELKEGDRLYHRSDRKITGFLPKETCFHTEDIKMTGHNYVAIVKENMTVQGYSHDTEVRLVISAENVDLFYIGERILEVDYKSPRVIKTDRMGRPYGEYQKKIIDKTISI